MDSQNDLTISIIKGDFVKLTHAKSGIAVTKHNKSQPEAAKEAYEEIKMLVELWESDGE